MDVSPKQLVSVAASLIPFLENDDANRALMGSKSTSSRPLIAYRGAYCRDRDGGDRRSDSGAVVLAKTAGEVVNVDATRIVCPSR